MQFYSRTPVNVYDQSTENKKARYKLQRWERLLDLHQRKKVLHRILLAAYAMYFIDPTRELCHICLTMPSLGAAQPTVNINFFFCYFTF